MSVSEAEYLELVEATPEQPGETLAPNLELLRHVSVELEVKIGAASVTVAELFALGAGSVLTLDRAVEEPVEVFLNGRRVAAGHLAVSGDQLGVRITDIVNDGKQLAL